MYLSKKHLAKIKKSKKAKPLHQILKEEESQEDSKNKNVESNPTFVENLALENALKSNAKPFHKTIIEEKHNLQDQLDDDDDQNFISGNNTKIKPINEQIRSLNRDTQLELEIKYQEIQHALNADVDIWDEHSHNISEEVTEDLEENLEAYKSFIHQVKTDHGRNKSLGKMDLKSAAVKNKVKRPVGFADKVRLRALSSDNGFSRGGGGFGF
ncbi:MAG: hypothetical protein ACJA02_000945 [Myxococcota bacterium]|jgi:hypothetical protein